MTDTLNLSTVELTSTLRTAPLNGAPSSSDYNESQRENLVDLATIVDFVNNQIIPLVNALPSEALEPADAPVGIEGRTIYADTSDLSALFFNSLTSTPLTLADALRVVNGIITTMKQQLIDQGVEIASLQARLASTNQNDIALALQNLSSALNQISVNQQIQNTQITEIQGAAIVHVRYGPTTVAAGVSTNIEVDFSTPYNDDFYSVSVSLECQAGANGLVLAGAFQRVSPGIGITVPVTNFGVASADIIIHVMASHD